MSGTAEGITVGEQQGLDPNNAADFEAIMAGRGVQVEEGEVRTPDRSIATGLTTAGPEQAVGRDPETGRFVPKEEQKPPAQAAAEPATDTSGAENGDFADDPETKAFLAKYDGDVSKALKGAANAQALIGRRDELAEAAQRELAELRGQVQGLMAGAAAPAASPLSKDQIAEIAVGRVETLGYEGAATEAANVAHKTGDDRALASVVEQWELEDRYAALNFLTDFKLWQRDQAKPEPTAVETPAWQATAEEQFKVAQYGENLVALREELGESFPAVAQNLDAALEQMPTNVLAMIDSNDREARDAGFRIVADRALRLAASAPAAPPVAATAPSPAVERKLAGSRVATGGTRPAPKSAEEPTTSREDAIREFKRAIVDAPTTNIASGLTYGGTP